MKKEIVRRPLLKSLVSPRSLTSVDIREIAFGPGQETGLHRHPCDVFGYIAEGEAVLEVEGEPPQRLLQGAAFHEPAGKTILRFDNASASAPMRFIAYYLLAGNEPLIEML